MTHKDKEEDSADGGGSEPRCAEGDGSGRGVTGWSGFRQGLRESLGDDGDEREAKDRAEGHGEAVIEN